MNRTSIVSILLIAALLEAAGDAVARVALHSPTVWTRAALFVLSAGILLGYGCTVNTPPWAFGKLLGLYVVFFFVIAQMISWIAFRQAPSAALLMGGGLIVTGGLVIALA